MINMIILVVFALIGLVVGYLAISIKLSKAKEQAETTLLKAEQDAVNLRSQAEHDADHLRVTAERESKAQRKEFLLEAKEEARKYREDIEKEFKSERQELKQMENRLTERATSLDRKDENLSSKELALEKKEQSLADKSKHLNEREENVTQLEAEKQAELERVGQMTIAEAREVILTETENNLTHEIATRIKDAEAQVKDTVDKKAKNLLAQAMQRLAGDYVTEQTVTTVHLPDDNMKGRIIGREGRNIRSFEALTGVDVIIDDTPDVVVLSGFDPIRREIAKRALERLIKDGRIHPARIEEMVDRARKEVNDDIYEAGESALMELGIHKMHPELVKILGRLKYRTSYGQNVLSHSIEVGKLTGVMAAELGLDEKIAVRAGLLHDIGKSIDHEIEGSHVEIGVELARKYHEPDLVVNAIAAHHDDVPKLSFIAELVVAADTISSARPGARSESLENYIRRLEQLETIAKGHIGVKQAYAIQAGREIRVMVEPDKISDARTTILAHDIRNQIEQDMEYPGNIKVTVIREKRAVAIAK